MTKAKKEFLPREEVKIHIQALVDDVKARKENVEKLQNSVKKLEEFNALHQLLTEYEAVEAMLKACRCLYVRENIRS